ncbi:transporter substrate-binding domain-containing protein [bacterium]|nr:transporter substrate-binding domain-containing protein [bacterium]
MIPRRILAAALAAVALSLSLASCTTRAQDPRAFYRVPPLRIGINSLSAPFSFQLDGRFVGIEVDFARELSRTLGRRIKFVDLPFKALIPSLLEGRVDVVMAGVGVTAAREVRVAFSQPYLHSGLTALVRRSDVSRFQSAPCEARFSVLSGSTGERFVREKCNRSLAVFPTDSREIAVAEVKLGRSDIMVSEASVVAWAVSSAEGDLTLRREPLVREDLAWAVRRQDLDLLHQIDGALEQWRDDGTRAMVLDRWVPFWRELEAYSERMPPPAQLP